MTVLHHSSYKDYLKRVVNTEARGIVKRLAEAAGCQRSYLSQVLSTPAHLTADHLLRICDFMRLNETETDYLLLLLERDKASSRLLRSRLDRKLAALQQESKELSKRIPSKLVDIHGAQYYSAWYYAALHVATAVEELTTEADFARQLSLPITLVHQTLRELEHIGLVKKADTGWTYQGELDIHLDSRSSLSRMNHLNWRMQALSRAMVPHRDIHYTSVFAISSEDAEKLRDITLEFIEEQRRTVNASGSEELISFCCDFFRLND